jgi:superfamily II DNA or RNA helicase
MKAVIANRIFMEVTADYQKQLRDHLTYMIPSYKATDPPITIRNMLLVKPGIVTIPSGRIDLIPDKHEVVDKRIFVPTEFPDFQGTLRPSQENIYNELVDCAIINAWVSFGKTFTALAIAKKLGQKTLVVTHTVPLRNQWIREIEKVFGFTPSIIGSGKFDIDQPITVGNVQTLYKRIPDISKAFGLVILDEMHHCSAPIFSKIIDTNHARYKIGLSGTLQRKDGKHVVFRDYFSNNVFKPPAENFMLPEVHLHKLDIKLPDGAGTPWAKRVNAVAYNVDYQHYIAMIAASYAAIGHKVLVVSDRVDFLKNCAELVGDKAISVTGDIKNHTERENLMGSIKRGEKEILFGTQSIFSEGISINELSCLILGTPLNNEPLLTQLVGRVIRELPGKPTPIVADIHLKGKTAERQARERLGFYIKQGWKLKTF